MTYEQFLSSIHDDSPPQVHNPLLKAMWYDANEDWNKAHDIAQDIHSSDGCRIHAYLHRKEGDISNALYWYSKAGKNEFRGSLEAEWEQIVKVLLNIESD